MSRPSSSFTASRVNSTTFLIVENDLYRERPFIYVKIHPDVPILVLTDTGCDEPAEEAKSSEFTHLRPFIESFPVPANDDQPLNPNGARPYLIILTHCHYDHIGGISQFLAGGTTQIVSSAAGRDFIESDLGAHSLCDQAGIPVPYYHVTHWAQSFERLTWPLATSLPGDNATAKADARSKAVDLGITIIHTPGHTPDELAWFDHSERYLYVGDSFYEEGNHAQAIIFPPQGNLIEWAYSTRKLWDFTQLDAFQSLTTDDADDQDWFLIPSRIKICAAHATNGTDGLRLVKRVVDFVGAVIDGSSPVLGSAPHLGEPFDYWRSDGGEKSSLSLSCPRRLVLEARKYFVDRAGQTSSSPLAL